jgi:hypothetical protein
MTRWLTSSLTQNSVFEIRIQKALYWQGKDVCVNLPVREGSAQKLLGVLSAKCPVFTGLLRAVYAKLFLYDP